MDRTDTVRRVGGWFRRGGRLALFSLIGVGAVAATAVLSAAGAAPAALRFAPAGHWLANPGLDTVFHINGAAPTVDARVRIEGMEPGSQVVQGDTAGYVIGRSRIHEFGKSSLSVQSTSTPPSDERPVAVEARGGPYLVYRAAGTVVRLGAEPATIPAGGALGAPVVTDDGTLWVHRLDANLLCHLTADADRMSCPAAVEPGHTGALTVVDQQVVFVDTQADTLSQVTAHGFGPSTAAGLDIPATAQVAGGTVAGKVAVLDQVAGRLHLVDTAGLAGRSAAPPVPVAVPAGSYAAPVAGRSSVVLLDTGRRTVRSFDGKGGRRQAVPLPPEAGEPRLSRGEDQRVYVEGGEGRHLLIVRDDGGVAPVSLTGAAAAVPGGGPATVARGAGPVPGRPAEPTRPARATPPAANSGGRTIDTRRPPATTPPPSPAGPAADTGGPPPAGPQRPAPTGPRPPFTGPPSTGPPFTGPPSTGAPGGQPGGPQPPPAEPPQPSSGARPGTPTGVHAVLRAGDVVVTWQAPGGASVTSYEVAWARTATDAGGSSVLPAGERSVTLQHLDPGTEYRITVAAVNPAGRGNPATALVTLPPSLRVFRGEGVDYDPRSCMKPECFYIKVEMRGFKPLTKYQIDPWTDDWGNFNDGAGLTTDKDGNLTVDDRFPCNAIGQNVWVVVDGMESNRLLWTLE